MKDNNRRKKLLAPLFWVLLFIIFIGGQTGAIWWVLSRENSPILVRIAVLIIPLLLAGALIAVYLERMRELRRGQEDDLEKY